MKTLDDKQAAERQASVLLTLKYFGIHPLENAGADLTEIAVGRLREIMAVAYTEGFEAGQKAGPDAPPVDLDPLVDLDEIPEAVREEIDAARPDIDYVHWDDAVEEDYPNVGHYWQVPVEKIFTVKHDECTPDRAGVNHGTLEIELDDRGNLIAYGVIDWTHGTHPALHTFER